MQKHDDVTPDNDGAVLSNVIIYLSLFIAVGSIIAVIHNFAYWTSTVLWACACLGLGGLGGFLFGIPRTLQGRQNPETITSPDRERTGKVTETFGQRVNTNLEEISDWLTKILVGLGLAEIKYIPTRLQEAGAYIAGSFGGDSERQFALALFFWLHLREQGLAVKQADTKVDAHQELRVALADLEASPEPALLQAHITTLEQLKPHLPTDRALYITLGRLYKELKRYDEAINTLTEFISNKKRAKQDQDIATGDAFYNRSCYEALKSAEISDEASKKSLQSQAVEDLQQALARAPYLKDTAKNDSDFHPISSLEEFKRIVA